MGLFLFVLLGGMGFFIWEYAANAQEWVLSTGSPHLYHNGNLGCGTVVDRDGNLLMDLNGDRVYSENELTRRSMMHWLGDRSGYIRAGAVSHYVDAMTGYDPINGIYNYSGTGGTEILTISSRVQNAALNALAGRKGTVAVYNYRTGEILCAVTAPTYDPDNAPDSETIASEAYEGVYLNRFLQSSYPPGSIFKTVTTAAALECVSDIQSKTFSCTGRYSYGTEAVTCETAHGYQNLQQALANSCNCAFAQIAELVGRKNMEKYVERFLITEPISFDGVTSVQGNYDIRDAGAVSFAWSCIGQHSDLINPCRFMTYMGMVAGGGQAAEPFLVAQVRSGDSVTYTAEPKTTPRIMEKETAAILCQYMRNNVVTVYGADKFPGITVCAKSGTSQLGGGLRSNAMFAGFVTDEKYPFAFVIVVENGGYGAHTCTPILQAVLKECKALLDGN